jgi:hypothetical protein
MYKRNGFQVPMPLCAIYSILCVTWCQLGIIDIFDCVPLAGLWRAFASWEKAVAI